MKGPCRGNSCPRAVSRVQAARKEAPGPWCQRFVDAESVTKACNCSMPVEKTPGNAFRSMYGFLSGRVRADTVCNTSLSPNMPQLTILQHQALRAWLRPPLGVHGRDLEQLRLGWEQQGGKNHLNGHRAARTKPSKSFKLWCPSFSVSSFSCSPPFQHPSLPLPPSIWLQTSL